MIQKRAILTLMAAVLFVSAAPVLAQSEIEAESYTVVWGDTLCNILRERVGRCTKIEAEYWAARNGLDSPDLIFAGTSYDVPVERTSTATSTLSTLATHSGASVVPPLGVRFDDEKEKGVALDDLDDTVSDEVLVERDSVDISASLAVSENDDSMIQLKEESVRLLQEKEDQIQSLSTALAEASREMRREVDRRVAESETKIRDELKGQLVTPKFDGNKALIWTAVLIPIVTVVFFGWALLRSKLLSELRKSRKEVDVLAQLYEKERMKNATAEKGRYDVRDILQGFVNREGVLKEAGVEVHTLDPKPPLSGPTATIVTLHGVVLECKVGSGQRPPSIENFPSHVLRCDACREHIGWWKEKEKGARASIPNFETVSSA